MKEWSVLEKSMAFCSNCCCVGNDEELLFLGLPNTARYFLEEEQPKVTFLQAFSVRVRETAIIFQSGTKGFLEAIHRPGSPHKERFGYYVRVSLNDEYLHVVIPLCQREILRIEF